MATIDLIERFKLMLASMPVPPKPKKILRQSIRRAIKELNIVIKQLRALDASLAKGGKAKR